MSRHFYPATPRTRAPAADPYGPLIQPPASAFWSFQSKLIQFPIAGTRKQLYPPPGPLLVEWLFIEADIFNDDYLMFGTKDVVNSSGGAPPLNVGIVTLSPGEWCCFEPNDKGDSSVGVITGPGGEPAGAIQTYDDWDQVDATQFFLQGGLNSLTGLSVHVTIGTRNRR